MYVFHSVVCLCWYQTSKSFHIRQRHPLTQFFRHGRKGAAPGRRTRLFSAAKCKQEFVQGKGEHRPPHFCDPRSVMDGGRGPVQTRSSIPRPPLASAQDSHTRWKINWEQKQ